MDKYDTREKGNEGIYRAPLGLFGVWTGQTAARENPFAMKILITCKITEYGRRMERASISWRRHSAANARLARMARNEYDKERHFPIGSVDMVQVFGATFEDGVFKPDQRPDLSGSARVRLVVEAMDANESARADESWAAIHQLWSTSRFNSGGDHMNRDQLHERR